MGQFRGARRNLSFKVLLVHTQSRLMIEHQRKIALVLTGKTDEEPGRDGTDDDSYNFV